MGSGYKHFSHTHKLEIHDMPEGAEGTCSGCNSPATKTIYICWQCNFILHEQCFQATRSKKHPSHPLHPLTLAAYPTYPDNSFYCNSCNIMGTGFSYSCSDCDFNLHVHCAYLVSFQNQELVPQSFHGQSSSMVPNIAQVSTPFPSPNLQAPTVYAQYPTNVNQDPFTGQNLSHISFPAIAQNPAASPHAYASQNLPNFHLNAPKSSFHPTNLTQDSYMAQNAPLNSPNTTTSAYNMYTPKNFDSIPTSAHSSSIPQYQTSITQDSNKTHTVSQTPVPSISESPNSTPQKVYASQNNMSVPPSSQNPPAPQNTIDHNTAPSAPYENPSHYEESGPKIAMNQEIKHFSHPHGLVLVNIKPGKKKKTCSGCQETIVGKGYACAEENCGFQLDESCFNLEKEIWHNSHPSHSLALLSSTKEYEDGMFICTACLNSKTGFTYHCSICQYDLDIKCANVKETVKRDDHEHALKLYYECPLKCDTFYCDVCSEVVSQDHWAYYCQECDYGTHFDCVDREKSDDISGDHNADESCFNLEKEIRHKSHPSHPLALLSSSPYASGMFACSACFNDRTGFTYHCSICEYDLDLKCANLRETVKRDDHEHTLKLYYDCPLEWAKYTFYCDVCTEVVSRDNWAYYCQECNYGTHLDCADREKSDDFNADERTNEQTLRKKFEINSINALAREYALDNI